MPDRKIPPLTPDQLHRLVLDHGISGTAAMYGVSRQRVHQLVIRHGLGDASKEHIRKQRTAAAQRRRERQKAELAERQAKRDARPTRYVPSLTPLSNAASCEDVAITLSNGDVCYISGEDADLALVKWQSRNGYASMGIYDSSPILMHRLVMARALGSELPAGLEVDHIDGDPLNNRRDNLRPATRSLNQANRKLPKTNTSGYKGVYRNKLAARWMAYIKGVNLDYFETPQEAARAYDKAAVELYGEYAMTNEKMGLL